MKTYLAVFLCVFPAFTAVARHDVRHETRLPAKTESKSAREAPPAAASGSGAPSVSAKSYLLLDYQSNQVLASQNPDERMEPASLTKLMTAYLVFEALNQKKLEPNQAVPVSQHAWKVEGSRMFIEPNKPVTVDELLHGVIVQSGNDASIALAEALSGSEEAFAEQMNKTAQRLGLKDTHYANSTGLPDAQLYSTARDLGQMAAAVIRDYPDFYKLYAIKEYKYNNIAQPNRNRLLWLDANVDGLKTGHTEGAGYCLVSSSRRGDRRLIVVLLGAASESARTIDSQRLLNYGFQAFETERVFQKDSPLQTLPVYKGKLKEVKAGFNRDIYLSLPKGELARRKEALSTTQPLIAPLFQGQKVGTMQVTVDGKTVSEYPVLALQGVPLDNIFGRAWDTIRLLLLAK